MVKVMTCVQDNQQAILDHFNQYNGVHNAWFDVSYGSCQFGIFSAACPIKPLYLLENGIIPDCLTILFKDEMCIPQKAGSDSIFRRLVFLPPHQHFFSMTIEPCIPHLLWKDGVMSLTDLPGKLKGDIMFAIVVVSLQEGT
jgi:hypothetical protein